MLRRMFLGLALLATSVSWFLLSGEQWGLLPFTLWIIGILLITILHRSFLTGKKVDKTLSGFTLILLTLYTVRLFFLTNPKIVLFHGDEAINSKNAIDLFDCGIKNGAWNLLAKGDGTLNSFPALWFYLQGLIIRVMGSDVASTKILAWLTDLGICWILYYVTKSWLGNRAAKATALIYATLPIAMHFGMTGYNNIQSTFFLWLTLALLTKGLKGNSTPITLLAGMSCGLGMYFYLSSAVNPIVALVVISAYFWKKWQKVGMFLGYFLAGFILLAIPFIFYSLEEYNFLQGRAGVFELGDGKTPYVQIIANQASRYLSGFWPMAMNGSGGHYIEAPALPNLLTVVFLLAGILWLAFDLKKYYAIGLVSILVLVSVVGGILTETPPAPQRLIHLFPTMAIVITMGIELISRLSSKLLGKEKLKNYFFWLSTFLVVATNIFSFLNKNIQDYFNAPKDEYRLASLYIGNGYKMPLLTHVPIHKKDQIFFYSGGKISPVQVESTTLSETIDQMRQNGHASLLFLGDSTGVEILKSIPGLITDEIEWQNREDYRLLKITFE